MTLFKQLRLKVFFTNKMILSLHNVFFYLLLLIHRFECRIIGAAILPHGDFAYDPSLVNYENGSSELHNASMDVGNWIMNEMKLDLIFLSTPHGMALDDNFIILENVCAMTYFVEIG